MEGLSIIVPFVNEWPQVAWTLQSLHQDMISLPHEVIAINNHCKQAESFGEDRGHAHVESMARRNDWLKCVHYNKELSHWQAKNYGAAIAQYDTLFFCDAHVLPSYNGVSRMYTHFKSEFDSLSGTLHMPLTYHILETERLIYRIVDDRKKWGLLGYTFHPAFGKEQSYEVPVMSTCGMMVGKNLFDEEMVWPKIFGIYGGGENYFNYAMAIKGYKKWIYPKVTLFHHGDKRGYRYNLPDFAKNRAAAMAIVCGIDMAEKLLLKHKDFKTLPPAMLARILHKVTEETVTSRQRLLDRQVIELEDFLSSWSW